MNPKVTCETGGLLVLASGLGITSDKGADYDIHIRFDETFEFTVRLKFVDKDTNDKPDLHIDTNAKSRLITLECGNFTDVIGIGTTKPLNLATYRGKRVYFNFWVRTPMEEPNREIRYCFYLDKQEVGKNVEEA